MIRDRKLFAVIPAAGHSRRMGRPKLLLPLGEQTVIRRLLDVLDRADVDERLVVLRRDDESLRTEVEAAGAKVVAPKLPPPDMRASVEHALAEIRDSHQPNPNDGWLLIPADHPLLSSNVLEQLIVAWNQSEADVLVPTFEGRRGHPTFFRWRLADEITAIPPDRGLSELLNRHSTQVQEVAVEDRSVVVDLDTPEDYEALCQQYRDRDNRPS